jgi:hypothetical protein
MCEEGGNKTSLITVVDKNILFCWEGGGLPKNDSRRTIECKMRQRRTTLDLTLYSIKTEDMAQYKTYYTKKLPNVECHLKVVSNEN